MSTAQDRKFLDWFMRAVGVLAGFAATMVLLASYALRSAHTAPKDPMDPRAIETRIAPIERVAVSGRDSAAAGVAEAAATPGAPSVATASATPAAATGSGAALSGEQVYASTCIACHGAGVAGAPKFGDKAAWSARIGEGAAVLHKHALEGFQGKAGIMPPKGGRIDLADQSIVNAVDYMVSAAK